MMYLKRSEVQMITYVPLRDERLFNNHSQGETKFDLYDHYSLSRYIWKYEHCGVVLKNWALNELS